MQQDSTEEMVKRWAIYIDPRTGVKREQVYIKAAEAASLAEKGDTLYYISHDVLSSINISLVIGALLKAPMDDPREIARGLIDDPAFTDEMADVVVDQSARYEPTEKEFAVLANHFGLDAAVLKADSDWIRQRYCHITEQRSLAASAQEQEHSLTAQAKDRAQNKAQRKAQRAAKRKH